jgi:predicted MFS family arabinose efflux permease
MTGIGIGMALGAFISGWVIDNFGPSNGFWVSIAATLSTVTIISLGQRSLSGETNRSATTTAAQPAE